MSSSVYLLRNQRSLRSQSNTLHAQSVCSFVFVKNISAVSDQVSLHDWVEVNITDLAFPTLDPLMRKCLS